MRLSKSQKQGYKTRLENLTPPPLQSFNPFRITLQHTATQVQHRCRWRRSSVPTVQHTTTHCNTLYHTASHCNTSVIGGGTALCNSLQHVATHCNALQHAVTRCNADVIGGRMCGVGAVVAVAERVCPRCNTLLLTVTLCNIIQRTTTCCNTLQHRCC